MKLKFWWIRSKQGWAYDPVPPELELCHKIPDFVRALVKRLYDDGYWNSFY